MSPKKQATPKAPADPADDQLIRAADFESMRLKITIKNTTTRTAFRDTYPIQVIELLKDGLTLEVPPKSCSAGHNLALSIEVTLPGETDSREIECTAKVTALEPIGDEADQITISLVQYEKRDWDRLFKNFSNRQAEIEEFFRAAKGF